MSLVLRDYQQQAVDALWAELFAKSSALCVLPTGVGKTEIFMALMQLCIDKMPSIKIVVMVNKIGLLDQTYNRLGKSIGFKDLGIYCGSRGKYETHKPITISTIQSIHAMPMEKLNLLILDEVHNVSQESGRYFNFIKRNKELNPKLKVVAFTATPFRASGLIYGPSKLFTSITFQKHLNEMIDRGFLVRPRMKKVEHQFNTDHLKVRMGEYDSEQIEKLTSDEKKVVPQIIDALSRMKGKHTVVWACSSINHCKLVYRLLVAQDESAVTLHSKLTDEERTASLKYFESEIVRHMVFVSIVSEGYDYPPIDCIVLMRPTRSPVLYVQTVGRGLRPSPGKDDLLVLDYGRVVESCGPLDNPKMVDGNRSRHVEPRDMKFCPSCLEYCECATKECAVCGYLFPGRELPQLEPQADENASLLYRQPKPQTYAVRSVGLEKYKSKNGNDCLKIVYRTENVLAWPIPEFFVWDNDWAHRKMQARLVELGVDMKPTLDEQAMERVTRKPVEIVVLEEKYPKIVRLCFDGTSVAESDIRLAQ